MIRVRNVYVALTLTALAALPACSKVDSMLGRSSGGSTGTRAAAQPVANDMVRQVQARLQRDGYYQQGAVDGVWGTGTMNAVQSFQRDHNLTASGRLDVPTLQALNIADTGNNPSLAPATGTVGTGTGTTDMGTATTGTDTMRTGTMGTGATGDLTRPPGSTTPNTANPTYTGPSTMNPAYPGPTTTTPATRTP